jgi:hypothetical protein
MIMVQARLGKKQVPISKITRRAGGVAQAVALLRSKHEALSSNPNIATGGKKDDYSSLDKK